MSQCWHRRKKQVIAYLYQLFSFSFNCRFHCFKHKMYISANRSVFVTWLFMRSVLTLNELAWWRHQMETFYALLAFCAGNAQRPVTRSFDDLFDLYPNKRLGKQSWGWWFERPSRSLWHHCYGPSNLVDMVGNSPNQRGSGKTMSMWEVQLAALQSLSSSMDIYQYFYQTNCVH